MAPEVDQDQAIQSIKARGLEGWDAVSAGVTLGVDEDRLRAEFKPDTGDLDWSASYNYILFGVGPGDDGAGAKGHMSRRQDENFESSRGKIDKLRKDILSVVKQKKEQYSGISDEEALDSTLEDFESQYAHDQDMLSLIQSITLDDFTRNTQ